MTRENQRQIGHLQFYLDRPTEYSFSELQTWIIWQFPRTSGEGLLGAVHPPIAQHGWLPALVHPYKKRVIIHAHHPQTYPTPEAAADAL